MPAESPEAVGIPRFNPAGKFSIKPPINVAGTGGTASDAYNSATNEPAAHISLQNIGTNAVFVALNQTATGVSFHKCLAGASGAGKGDGGTMEIDAVQFSLTQVSLFAAAGFSVAVTQFVKTNK